MTASKRVSTVARWLVELTVIAAAVFIGIQLAAPLRDAPPGESDAPPREDETPLGRLGMREDEATAGDADWSPPSKVVVLDLWPGRTGRLAEVAPGVQLVVAESVDDALAELGDADALLGAISPALLEAGPRLRWVQIASAGVERQLAIPGFAEREIVLTNAQRIFAPGGAEHVMALTLALARRLPRALELQRNRVWDPAAVSGPSPYVGAGSELIELRGRTMLVAGLGGIGTETARVASGLGMRVLATRNSSRIGPPFVEYVGLSHELPELAGRADVVVNALPFTGATERLFDAETFAAMKPGAYFVNIGRGGTVDQEALIEALASGHLGGAGLDVTDPEPLPADSPLWSMPNVIITPHVGGDSDGHMERMFLLFQENLRRFATGEPLLSVVDRARGY